MSTIKAAIVCLLAASATLAADPSGKWEAVMQSPRGEMQMVFNLKADGDKLTGTVGNEMMGESEIQDGKVSGDEIAFKQVIERGDRTMTIEWKGAVKGDELELTRSFSGGRGGAGAREGGPAGGRGGPGGGGRPGGGRGGMGGGSIVAKRVQ